MWWGMLLACSRSFCDTRPEDLVVEDPDGFASDEARDAAEAGLDDFRSWTGRDAICVADILFVESLERPEDFPEDFDPAGRYEPRSGNALIEDHELQTRGILRHELCHALDWTEDLSEPHAELFAEAVSGDGPYPEERRVVEAFARACGQGPRFGVDEAVAEYCDLATEPDPVDVFLREEVYLGFDYAVDVVPGGLDVEWTALPELSAGLYYYDVVPTWNGLAASLVQDDGSGAGRLQLVALDGTVIADVDGGPAVGFLYPVPWNRGGAFLAVSIEAVPLALSADGTLREAPGLGDSAWLAWDDVVFAITDEGDLVTRDLWTGDALDVGIDPTWWSEYATHAVAFPVGDAVVVTALGEGWIGTPATGWTWTDDVATAGYPLDDLVVQEARVSPPDGEARSVIVGVADDGSAYTLPDECSDAPGQLVRVDGAPWLMDVRSNRFGRVVRVP